MDQPTVRAKVNAALTKKYSGSQVKHALDVVIEALAKIPIRYSSPPDWPGRLPLTTAVS